MHYIDPKEEKETREKETLTTYPQYPILCPTPFLRSKRKRKEKQKDAPPWGLLLIFDISDKKLLIKWNEIPVEQAHYSYVGLRILLFQKPWLHQKLKTLNNGKNF